MTAGILRRLLGLEKADGGPRRLRAAASQCERCKIRSRGSTALEGEPARGCPENECYKGGRMVTVYKWGRKEGEGGDGQTEHSDALI